MIKENYKYLKDQYLKFNKLKKEIKDKKEIKNLRKIDKILFNILFFGINKEEKDNEDLIIFRGFFNLIIFPLLFLMLPINFYFVLPFISIWYFLHLCKLSLFIFDINRFEKKKIKKKAELLNLPYEKLKNIKSDPNILNLVFNDLDKNFIIKYSDEVIELINNVKNTNKDYFFEYHIKNKLISLYGNNEISFEEFVSYIKKYLAKFENLNNDLISETHGYITAETKNIQKRNEILNLKINTVDKSFNKNYKEPITF